jgi:hypothetical protein
MHHLYILYEDVNIFFGIAYLLHVMPDLIPAKDGIVDRHPVASTKITSGFRVKPGMTMQENECFCLICIKRQ